jgi:hypothetical protein
VVVPGLNSLHPQVQTASLVPLHPRAAAEAWFSAREVTVVLAAVAAPMAALAAMV